MAKVEFTRVETDEEVENLDIKDGRFIVTGEGKAFIDYGENRIGIGGTPDTQMSDSSTNSVENRVIKGYVDNEIEDAKDLIPNLSNTYGTSNENGYTQEYINGLHTPTITTSGDITYIKYGNIVIINGKLPSNVQEGTVTLPYTSKYYFGFGFTGYYPINGNTQAYGYAVAKAGSTTLRYKASAAFTDAPICAIYYTDN